MRTLPIKPWRQRSKPMRIAILAGAIVLAYAAPLLELPLISTDTSQFAGILASMAVYALVAVGLNVVVGYAGLLDLGYIGFFAVGAYTVGVLTSLHAHISFLLVVPVAVVVTMISGVILGAPTLRVRGDYLAIVTLGFGEIIRLITVNSEWLGAAAGIPHLGKPPSIELFDIGHLDGTVTKFLKFGVIDATPYYWLVLTVLILILIGDVLVHRSRVGRAWEATREDEDVAELMGVPTFKFKLLAFAMGAFVGGLAGALYASRQGFIDPNTFPLLLSFLFLSAVVLGGQGNRWGVVLGGALVVYLPERFQVLGQFRFLLFGVALMLIVIYRPQGLLPPRRSIRARAAAEEIDALEHGDLEEGGRA